MFNIETLALTGIFVIALGFVIRHIYRTLIKGEEGNKCAGCVLNTHLSAKDKK